MSRPKDHAAFLLEPSEVVARATVNALMDRVADVLRRSGASFNTTTKDGEVTRHGVLTFADVHEFAARLSEANLTASYSAGSGWTFVDVSPPAPCPCGEPNPPGSSPCTFEKPCGYGEGMPRDRWVASGGER